MIFNVPFNAPDDDIWAPNAWVDRVGDAMPVRVEMPNGKSAVVDGTIARVAVSDDGRRAVISVEVPDGAVDAILPQLQVSVE